MLEGAYDVVAQTPLGRKRGCAVFAKNDAGKMTVRLEVSGAMFKLERARIAGDEFELAGTVSILLFGTAPFTCTGCVEGDRISATATSKNISIEMLGTRI